MYWAGVTNQNYLRGVQESGTDGTVTFTTIFPGCYQGRMPHIHFEVYRSAEHRRVVLEQAENVAACATGRRFSGCVPLGGRL